MDLLRLLLDFRLLKYHVNLLRPLLDFRLLKYHVNLLRLLGSRRARPHGQSRPTRRSSQDVAELYDLLNATVIDQPDWGEVCSGLKLIVRFPGSSYFDPLLPV